jgi:ferredoxin
MDIRRVGDHECISCGKCITACPTGAISYKGPKILLAPNEIGNTSDGAKLRKIDPVDAPGTPLPKKTRIARGIVAGIMALSLAGALIYYNFIDKVPDEGTSQQGTLQETNVGGAVGDICFDHELNLYGSDETVSVEDYRGKVTIVNFWYIFCGSCVKELQTEFPLIKEEYGDRVEILAVHSYEEYNSDIPAFIEESFPGADFTFCRDTEGEAYFHMLGGSQAWPVTVVLDQEGVIVTSIMGSTTYEELKEIIDGILQ